MKRREFVGLFSAAMLGQDSGGSLPQFPTLAHQLVWRNWDLVPLARIAESLACSASSVQQIADEMKLPAQHLDSHYARRQRFQILRRNWVFVPMSQLTILCGMQQHEIQDLLSEDAFYQGHLGPKPANRRIVLESGARIAIDYIITGSPSPSQRFEFAAAMARDAPLEPAPKPIASFLTRIAFPYTALYGDVLSDPDFDSFYPDDALRVMKRQGIQEIWLHGLLRDLTTHSLLPGYGSKHQEKLAKLNRLIRRCADAELGVYLYLNEPRAMPSAFFASRPDLKGDAGRPNDGLTSLCTSTEMVRRWLQESVQQLLERAPKLRGLILITASENPTNCYSLRRQTGCPRCRRRTPAEVIGEVVDEIRQGARSVAPETKILAWDWSWGVVEDDPQEKVIAALPKEVTLQVDFERGTPARRLGRDTLIDEYSLSVPGPSPRAQKHIAQAKARGMSVVAKVQIGNSWELSLLPFIPVPNLIADKCIALRNAGLDGAMLSWTLGTWPSPNWLVVRECLSESAPAKNAALQKAAAQCYGEPFVEQTCKAWTIFSNAFAQYPYSNRLVYSSVVQQGPAHPVWLKPSGEHPKILNSFDDLGWTQPYGPEAVAQSFRKMAAAWKEGISAFAPVAESGSERARADQRIHLAGQLYFESIANQIEIHRLRGDQNARGRIRRLIRDELRIAEAFLPLCEADPRIGFEASLQYFYLPQDIREKILWCRAVLKQFR